MSCERWVSIVFEDSAEDLGDLGVGVSFGDQLDDLDLARRQPIEAAWLAGPSSDVLGDDVTGDRGTEV